MNFNERLNAFRRIDALVRRKGTGTPKQLSERLETSEKTTYRYLALTMTHRCAIANKDRLTITTMMISNYTCNQM